MMLSKRKNDLVVYTAIFGDIGDKLQPAPQVYADVWMHAFVDGVTSRVWNESLNRILLPAVWEHTNNPRLRARRHKLLSHELYRGAEYTLWHDGCLTPLTDPWELVDRYLQDVDICVFKHMQRNCIYQEERECVRLKKDSPEVLDRVASRYRAEGYPEHNGLAETTAVLRRHTSEVKAFNQQWWEELRENSIRDQMSFDYLMWRNGMKYSTFEGTRCASPHFKWRPHR